LKKHLGAAGQIANAIFDIVCNALAEKGRSKAWHLKYCMGSPLQVDTV